MEVTNVSIPNQNPKEESFVGVRNWQVDREGQVVPELHEEQSESVLPARCQLLTKLVGKCVSMHG